MKYWTELTEQKVVEYINETDDKKRSIIYKEFLQRPLKIMTECILARYFKSYDPDLKAEAIALLLKNIFKFDPARGHTAFSFCQTVLKNFYSYKIKFNSHRIYTVLPDDYDEVDTTDKDYDKRVSDLRLEALERLKGYYHSSSIDIDKKVLKAVYHLISTNSYSNKYYNGYYLLNVCKHTVTTKIELVLRKFNIIRFVFTSYGINKYQTIIRKYLLEMELNETEETIKKAFDNYQYENELRVNTNHKNLRPRKFIKEDDLQRIYSDLEKCF